LVVVVAVVVF